MIIFSVALISPLVILITY